MIRLPARRDVLRDLPRLALTLAVGAAGAGVFVLLGLPVPYISGSMVAVAAATVAGAPLAVPGWFTSLGFFVLGINIGAAVTPETIQGIARWPASIFILMLGLPLIVVACTAALVVWRGWSRDDALLASVPGAMSVTLVLADATKADVPRIAMVQAMRVAILVAILPPLITSTFGDQPPLALPERALVGPVDLLLLVTAGLVGMAILKALRFPAVAMSGAMIASAVLHGTDAVSSVAPQPVLIASFVILGAVIGIRFSGLTWARLRAGMVDALLVFVVGFTVAAATAIIATWWLGISFAQTILAFAPGAFEVMVVMAFLLGADAAYVGAHHAVRFIALALLTPILFRRRAANRAEPEEDPTPRGP